MTMVVADERVHGACPVCSFPVSYVLDQDGTPQDYVHDEGFDASGEEDPRAPDLSTADPVDE